MAWERLCALADVAPGAIHAADLKGTPVLVVRGTEGLMVIPPSCPHMANPLCEGFFDGGVLTCNKHLWQWTIPGGEPIGEAEKPLRAYDSETRDGEIWVDFDAPLAYEHEET